MRIRPIALASMLFLLAFLVRGLILHQATPSNYDAYPVEIDGWSRIAASIAAGNGYSWPASCQAGWDADDPNDADTTSRLNGQRSIATAARPPLFPLLLASWYDVAGYDAERARWLQVLLSSIAAVLVYALTLQLGGSQLTAVGAGILWCLHYKQSELCLRLWSEPLFALVLLAAVVTWTLTLARRRPVFICASGVAAGLIWLTRPEGFLIVVVIAVATCICFPRTVQRSADPGRGAPPSRRWSMYGGVLLWAATVAVVASPWVVRNALTFRAFIPGDTTGGFNFYEGTITAGYVYVRDFDDVIRREISTLGEVDRDERLVRHALQSIVDDPLRYVRLALRRVELFWFNMRDPDGSSWIPTRRSLMLGLPLYALALAGWVLDVRRNRVRASLIMAIIAASVLVHAATSSNLRASLPYVGFIVAYAALALAHGPRLRKWPLRRRPGT